MTSRAEKNTAGDPDADESATVIASYGQRGLLRTTKGNHRRYVLKGRKLRAVCGDRVRWRASGNADEVLLTLVLPRHNLLERPDTRGKAEALAANLEQLFVVLAPEPAPDFFIADRFICAAELLGVAPLIIWNKSDLAPPERPELDVYRELGYPVIAASTEIDTGLTDLSAQLGQGISLLVGQSGVGKSSLINCLISSADVLIGELSAGSGEGKHTTTASYMHPLDRGGYLIDSPGIREFAPVIRDSSRIQSGFREIVARADLCRFADCQHTREPNCAVKSALEAGEISQRRYDSYKRLRNITAGTGLADNQF